MTDLTRCLGRQLGTELREAAERGLAIFSIHYGEWSAAYCDLRRKLATVCPGSPD